MSDSPIVKTNGPKGDDGPPGEAATIQVGTTTTLPPGSDATVVNVGDENAAIFDFGIPEGEQGPAGGGGVPDPAPLNQTLRGDGAAWVSSSGLTNTAAGAVTIPNTLVVGSSVPPGVYDMLVDGDFGVSGAINAGVCALQAALITETCQANLFVTETLTPTVDNQLASKFYVDSQAGGGGFWSDAGSNDIQNNNTGSVLIQNALFAGPCLVTSLAQTAVQVTSGGNMVRWDYWNSNSAKASTSITAGSGLTGGGTLAANRTLSVDTTVLRTSGNQTASGTKTFTGTVAAAAFQMTGTCNIGNLASNASTFVMCYSGNFMYRGPFIAAGLDVRNALLQIANLAGLDASMVETILTANNLSLATVTASPP